MEEKHTLSILVRNHPGVLSHIAGLFARRAYNIESIAAGVTEKPDVTRITIVVTGDEDVLEQVIKQLRKLIDVIKVVDLKYSDSITRELAIITVNCNNETRGEIIEISDVFNSTVVDLSESTVTIQVTGNDRQIKGIIKLLSRFGIEEMARTGVIALPYKSVR
ncbi:MAG: acetolactate synthase small subunit [Candidatus Schekmanbacteria bacterium RIFCSPHIGHO2_02_FULL_38_11]|uniref:Acetolactate synthase small subunit n=1 Tax=Candidatus Schekmanbacteria bacterium RIFCSPLOWO2_12_FULL_38_15 TaxID=1817883 RepID=A0A1F7SJI4_9BACT|nr:MAG: acetolactate synthase small subunit [Candidatus Schekmanbacteria bacterium GWA2_38_9]OGL50842.1 MAG: acetolactate synthase small subunit [Candidatus Schekmanbacteria bacterium RIFCSPLOWO2_02_FULL_38_14]OGL53398.1 MAG: acetolactate synthase small subunit [Candidatus Schekmanbacteria bacterium RIFCSPLOWO2_12_FULL_38_15]OGL55750.1 MAG: acetolactate synthase small subunit [Candidatus Schekmanbacteria bacterium RIFCSPHIGHO2_02_FULL_38_11]